MAFEDLDNWPGKQRRTPKIWQPDFLTLNHISSAIKELVLSLEDKAITVLDIGCGQKPYYPFLVGKVKTYIGVDIQHWPGLDCLAKGEELPFKGETFDLILSTQALEHVENPQKVIKEIHRICKTNGILFISLPFLWEIHNYPHDYWRFSEQGIRLLLRMFRDVEIFHSGNSLQALVQTFNLFLDRNMKRKLVKRWIISFTNLLSLKLASRSKDTLLPANYIALCRK